MSHKKAQNGATKKAQLKIMFCILCIFLIYTVPALHNPVTAPRRSISVDPRSGVSVAAAAGYWTRAYGLSSPTSLVKLIALAANQK